MKRRNTTNPWIWILVAILFVVIVVLFVASLGTVNISSSKESRSPAFKDSNDEARARHALLLVQLSKMLTLKQKLDNRFRRVYLLVRIFLVTFFASSVFLISKMLGAQTFEDYLNYYEGSIIAFFFLNYVAFGTIANFHDFIKLLRTKVENWIWMKYMNLPKDIEVTSRELIVIDISKCKPSPVRHAG